MGTCECWWADRLWKCLCKGDGTRTCSRTPSSRLTPPAPSCSMLGQQPCRPLRCRHTAWAADGRRHCRSPNTSRQTLIQPAHMQILERCCEAECVRVFFFYV